jgi:hypothetical protein
MLGKSYQSCKFSQFIFIIIFYYLQRREGGGALPSRWYKGGEYAGQILPVMQV